VGKYLSSVSGFSVKCQIYIKYGTSYDANGGITSFIIIIIIIISCRRFSFFPGTSSLAPVVNPTTQASSLSLWHFPYDV
jgi:hypothetical protein